MPNDKIQDLWHSYLLYLLCLKSFCSKKFIESQFWNFCLRDALRTQDRTCREVPSELVVGGQNAPYSNSSLVIWKPFHTPDNLTTPPLPPAILQLHYPVKLSHLAGDVNDSGQGLEAEGMQTFLERMNWADHSLVFPSLVPSACEGLGLGRQEATSGAAWIFAREGRKNSEPNNQELGRLPRTQDGGKKHWEKTSTYLRARPTWVFLLNLEVLSFLL